MKSTIRLFRAVPVETKGKKKASAELLKQTIANGFVFAPEVIANFSETELLTLASKVESEVGLSGQKANASFHKSWVKIKLASLEQLVIEQLVHYFTTYGYELFGVYDRDTIYVPDEKLKIPKLKDGISLTVIRGYTKTELKEKLLNLLNQGVALSEDTIKDVVDVALFVELDDEEIEGIRNREARVILYNYLDKVPSNPVEFLRYVIYATTGETLLIKNKKTIEAIKSGQNLQALKYFRKYKKQYGLEKLSEIFFRFKPLFLAFKTNTQFETNSQLRPIINRVRKLAKVHHKPMKTDYLNSVTANLKNEKKIKKSDIENALGKVNTFRKIRLAYALNFRTNGADSILYRVRNGKSFATDFDFENKDEAKRVLSVVLDSIVEDVKKNVKGKKIFVPKNMVYALPATEKQFTGDFPAGSYVTIPKDLVFGVHWDDVGDNRIDLDLSLISNTTKFGWDRYYRSEDRDILFSGDQTAAPPPNGASELFYVKRQTDGAYILLVNYFNYSEKTEVPFKILVASEPVREFRNNYMVNPNNVVCVAKSKINQKQKILGLVVTSPKENRFYFCESNIGNVISSRENKYTESARKYLFNYFTSAISLNEVLEKAGAKFVTDKRSADIDLSPEALQKDTILNLIAGSP